MLSLRSKREAKPISSIRDDESMFFWPHRGGLLPAPQPEEASARTVASVVAEELPAAMETISFETDEGADAAFDEYVALATKLGVGQEAVDGSRLHRFCAKHEIPIYDMKRVSGFLDKIQKAANVENKTDRTWRWSAIKNGYDTSNIPATSELAPSSEHKPLIMFTFTFDRARNGRVSSEQYRDKIPFAALRLVDQVVTEFPGAMFFVSELNMPKPDPFLAVKVGMAPLAVISHWDEPGFKLVDSK